MAKINNKKTVKMCTNCFSPQYIKFNFSYIVHEERFLDEYKLQLFKRMRELSDEPYVTIMNRDKKLTFEFEEIKVRKEIPKKFSERFNIKDYNNKLAIMRLYTNDNPIMARIIGVVINKIFYIFFIDIGGRLYKHG